MWWEEIQGSVNRKLKKKNISRRSADHLCPMLIPQDEGENGVLGFGIWRSLVTLTCVLVREPASVGFV